MTEINPTAAAPMAPVPSQEIDPLKQWAMKVATKKVGVGLAKYVTARAVSFVAGPTFILSFNAVAAALKPYGITLAVDQNILAGALPALIFSGLVAAHDWIKLKTNWTWL